MKALSVAAGLSVSFAVSAASAQTFTALGPQVTVASGVSTDGRTVVGWGGSDPFYRAVKWVDGVVTQLPIGPSDSISYAYAVSPNGQHIAGGSGRMVVIFDALEAVRWSGAGLTMTRLGLLPDTSSTVGRGISDDGNTIVGVATAPTEFGVMNMQAFRWRAGGTITRLTPASGLPWAAALGVSADGNFAVGYSRSSGFPVSTQHATHWNATGTAVDLGVPAGFTASSANTFAIDEVMVGGLSGAALSTVARYTASGWRPLPPLLPATDLAFGAADDLHKGAIVGIAYSSGVSGVLPFIWTPTRGTIDLQQYLISAGATGIAGWTNLRPLGMSGPGHVVGTGVNPATGQSEGWLASLPPGFSCYANCNNDARPDGTPILDIRDFSCFQNRFAVGDDAADCNGNGQFDVQDFTCFQNHFALGCG